MSELEGWFPNALDIHPFKYLAYKVFRARPGIAKGTVPFSAAGRTGASG
jgi:peptide/nickel transport system substrate-binding protein/oligopeptide transport system substrate-binding protein